MQQTQEVVRISRCLAASDNAIDSHPDTSSLTAQIHSRRHLSYGAFKPSGLIHRRGIAQSATNCRNSARVAAESLKAPSMIDVLISEFCFSTPRIIMHRCRARM